ncbi:MAG: DEAD/DEAH box helicase [Candidatus Lokiarchaeota archaeon]|nr:DEAD/DEAH box helicase [Candidatus Lokiarchaeota archaeon]
MNSLLFDQTEDDEEFSKDILTSEYLIPDKIQPREYQISIAQRVVGRNYLVTIPTSLGKTIIAVLVSAKTLEISKKNSKIIFLAPTKPLVTQQAKSFWNFMDNISNKEHPWETSVLTGSVKPTERVGLFEKLRILFYTPQTLRNDLLTGSYDLRDVALIIFDEAHKSTGRYSYVDIANFYEEMNPDGNILALTASPGSSKDKISTLCENLKIPMNNIAIRARDDDDVVEYVHELDIKYVSVEMTELMKDIREILVDIKIHRLMRINQLLSRIPSFEPLKTYRDKEVKSYEDYQEISQKGILALNGKILKAIKMISKGSRLESDKLLFTGLSLNAEILKLYHMITLTESYGLNILFNYLKTLQKDAMGRKSKAARNLYGEPRIRQIMVKLNKYNIDSTELLLHPKIFKLKDLIANKIKKTGKLKALVFADNREIIFSIYTIMENIKGIQPKMFVGQAKKSTKDTGLTQKEQIEIIKEFKAGKYNVLIATSVAEEGLDIAECDLVILFNISPSEIKMIQRMGRTARTHRGEGIILYCKNTVDERYLYIANAKKKAMYKNLGHSSKKAKKKSRKRKLTANKQRNIRENSRKSLLEYSNPPQIKKDGEASLQAERTGKQIKKQNKMKQVVKTRAQLIEIFNSIDKKKAPKRVFLNSGCLKFNIDTVNQYNDNPRKEAVNRNKVKTNSDYLEKPEDVNCNLISISRDIPTKYGIRKIIKHHNFKMNFFESLQNYEWYNDTKELMPEFFIPTKVYVLIWNSEFIERIKSNKMELFHKYSKIIKKIKEYFDVIIVFIDFLDTTIKDYGDAKQLNNIGLKFGDITESVVIPITKTEDLENILGNILVNTTTQFNNIVE